jgi:fibronectin type 3 domain-containing protein
MEAASTGNSANGYNIYRLVNDNEWQRINDTTISLNESVFADINAEAGTFCRYAVTAVNAFGAESEKTVSETVFVPWDYQSRCDNS